MTVCTLISVSGILQGTSRSPPSISSWRTANWRSRIEEVKRKGKNKCQRPRCGKPPHPRPGMMESIIGWKSFSVFEGKLWRASLQRSKTSSQGKSRDVNEERLRPAEHSNSRSSSSSSSSREVKHPSPGILPLLLLILQLCLWVHRQQWRDHHHHHRHQLLLPSKLLLGMPEV